MARKLLVFGNGLGMALNANRFGLDQAMKRVWDSQNPVLIDSDQKDLINRCLPGDIHCPQGEDDLNNVYKAATACSFLKDLQKDSKIKTTWLNTSGQAFPVAYKKFIKAVSVDLFENTEELPDTFISPLCSFLRKTKSHVATLNYDGLLYRPFVDNRICYGYSGTLLDGLRNSGFKQSHLKRNNKARFGYYLHLHGSPLIHRKGGKILKSNMNTIHHDDERVVRDVVLASVEYKKGIIKRSNILKLTGKH